MSSPKDDHVAEPIAIIGMGCRLPGEVNSPSDLWKLLQAGKSAQSDVPANRFNVDAWYHPDSTRPGSVNTRGGYFLSHDDSYRNFDPSFFGINPLEAASMDPQQRKLLEVVYESFESAGVTLDDVSGSNTACFVGNFTWDIGLMQARDIEYGAPYHMTGGSLTILSNRVNYLFNLKGPSLTLDTACSSSLYALHLACQSLAAGDCSAAVVGGTNLIFGIEQHIGSVRLGVLSPTSTCHTFDESADGYGRAEGVGAIYLKRLSQAIKDGDPIRAVIQSTAINANGRGAGISHPGTAEQEVVIRKAYANSGLDFGTTGYFEAHGTGTPVGDPLEVSAIGNVFSKGRSPEKPLLIGAVKSNLGHSEAASAIAQIIKIVLCLETGEIPATVGIKRLNPKIDFRGGRLRVVDALTPWPAELPYRRASINSFGYGGANAHAIIDAASSYLEAHPELLQSTSSAVPNGIETNGHRERLNGVKTHASNDSGFEFQNPVEHMYLLAFTAHDEPTLRNNIKAIVARSDDYSTSDLAFTLGRRSLFSNRAFGIVSKGNVASQLSDENLTFGIQRAAPTEIAFAFTGQGAQWPQMGYTLAVHFPSFRETLQDLDHVLSQVPNPPDWTILELLAQPKDTSKVYEVSVSQPLCSAVQIALVVLLKSWGVTPKAVVGHSSGEIAAAFTAGYITAAEAIIIAYQRGAACSRHSGCGAMMAVGIGAEKARKYIEGRSDVSIACYNSPESATLSGTEAAIDEVKKLLTADGIFCRKLNTAGNAYHSFMMKSVGEEYQKLLEASIPITSRNLPQSDATMYSSVDSKLVDSTTIRLRYWRNNLESPVMFSQATQYLLNTSTNIGHIIEIGRHAALSGPIREIGSASGLDASRLGYSATLKRGENGVNNLLQLAGALFLVGYNIDLAGPNNASGGGDSPSLLTDLPPYQWNYEDLHWAESRLSSDFRFRKHARHDLLGSRVVTSSPNAPSWRNILSLKNVPWLRDHKVVDQAVFPAAGYVALATEAVTQLSVQQPSRYQLQNVRINTAMVLNDESETDMMFEMRATQCHASTESRWFSFTVSSVNKSSEWTEHATGMVAAEMDDLVGSTLSVSTWNLRKTGGNIDRRYYSAMANVGLAYGATFQSLTNIQFDAEKDEAAANVLCSATKDLMVQESRYIMHPTALDGCFQLSVIAAHQGEPRNLVKPYLPVTIEHLTLWNRPKLPHATNALVHGKGKRQGLRSIYTNLSMVDGHGQAVLKARLRFLSLENSFGRAADDKKARQPYTRLVWKPDLDRLSSQKANEIFHASADNQLSRQMFSKLEEISALCILDSLDRLPDHPDSAMIPSHLAKLLDWMSLQARTLCNDPVSKLSSPQRQTRIADISKEIGKEVPEAIMVAKLNSRMPDIITGAVGSLDVMVEDSLLNLIYEEGFGQKGAYAQLEKALELVSHKEPRLRILELGAGTGGATRPGLRVLQGMSTQPKYEQYTFTDVSTAFLATAQDKFKQYRNMAFSILNIEQDPEAQGFETGTYDIVLAANVIHATSNIVRSLQNCRKLLKPNGKLIIQETTRHLLVGGYMLGTLPGYWLGAQDGRPSSPFITKEDWKSRLLKAGFSGSELTLHDYPEPDDCTSIMVSTNSTAARAQHHQVNGETTNVKADEVQPTTNGVGGPSPKPGNDGEAVWLIYRDRPHPLVAEIKHFYETAHIPHQTIALSQVESQVPKGARTIMCAELEAPLLSRMTEADMRSLQKYTVLASSAIWITAGGRMTGASPEHTLVFGLSKSIMTEQPSFRLSSYDIDPAERDYARSAKMIAEHEMRLHGHPDGQLDTELVEKDGVVHISRFITDDVQNEGFQRQFEAKPLPSTWRTRLELEFTKVGQIATFYFKRGSSAQDLVPEGHVLVEARLFAMDKKTLAAMKGQQDTPSFSYEIGGIVSSLGSAVKGLSVGDRVVCFHAGRFDSSFHVPQSACHKLSDEEGYEDFVGSLTPSSAALYALRDIGRSARGEKILIDAAGDSIGPTAAQIAQIAGAEVFATCATEEERNVLVNFGKVSQCNLIDPGQPSYAARIESLAGDHGLDVVLSTRGSTSAQNCWQNLARGGRLVVIGDGSDLPDLSALDASVFSRGASLCHMDILDFIGRDAAYASRLLGETLHLQRNGFIRSQTSRSFVIADLPLAAQYIESNASSGAAILKCDSDAVVPIHTSHRPMTLRSDASYLLVGCLGGLGRSLTKTDSEIIQWMVARGARHFIFLSRSAADKPEAVALINDLEECSIRDDLNMTVQVVRGDVGNRNDVAKAISTAKTPIKGVIQAAMVLRDTLFNTMSLEMFNAVINPKVLGTIHLHELLRNQDLDFFVMTSSLVGVIGATMQSNYCAGNAFLDHMARHRQSLGLQATSISLGMILEVGHVEEHPEVEKALKRNGMYGISEDEYLRTMELACRRREDLPTPTWGCDELAISHIVTGMDPTRVSRAGANSSWLHDNRLRNLVVAMDGLQGGKGTSGSEGAAKISTLQAVAGLSKEALKAAVGEHLLQKFSKLVLVPTSKMVTSKPLAFYGMDSMIGAEIRKWAWKEFQTDIPFLSLLDQSLTLEGLAQQIFEIMTAEKGKSADSNTQKAIVLAGPGKADLLTDRPIPKLRDDYILVKTEAVALNPTDWKHIDFANTPGALSGCDYAGIVEEVGSMVTKPFNKGDRITGFVHGANAMQPEDGAFAEYIVVKGDLQMRIPDNLSFEAAATLGVGITSVGQSLYQSQMLPLPFRRLATTQTPILIYGGSTASGVLGIQFAILSGYAPITTCSPRHFEMVKRLGATAAFDYRDPATPQRIKEYTHDSLMLAWDTVSTDSSARFCALVMASKGGGRYTSLLPVQCPRPDVESASTLAYTVFGETIMDGATMVPGRVKDFEFGKMWWSLCEDLLRDGKVVPHRVRVGKGGLGGVIEGLERMREGAVSGEKLVFRVWETV